MCSAEQLSTEQFSILCESSFDDMFCSVCDCSVGSQVHVNVSISTKKHVKIQHFFSKIFWSNFLYTPHNIPTRGPPTICNQYNWLQMVGGRSFVGGPVRCSAPWGPPAPERCKEKTAWPKLGLPNFAGHVQVHKNLSPKICPSFSINIIFHS